MSDNIKKLEKVLDTLSNLYEDAAEVDSDSASAISVAEDTVINAIKFLKASENESKWYNKNTKWLDFFARTSYDDIRTRAFSCEEKSRIWKTNTRIEREVKEW